MHKIFNKNTVKISYSCMNNISSILSTHNKNILNPRQTFFGCNCRNKDNCPLDGECLTPNIIYRADIATDNDHKFYYGTSETTFKHRHSNHTRDFKHVKYQHVTDLAKYIWQLKNNNFNYSIKWSIASKVYGYTNLLSCKLCLMEKYWIAKYFDHPNFLNLELINKCRHQNKILLMKILLYIERESLRISVFVFTSFTRIVLKSVVAKKVQVYIKNCKKTWHRHLINFINSF